MTALVDNQRWPLNTILVSQKHRVLFTPIAKNANTSFKRLFVQLSGREIPQDHDTVHRFLVDQETRLMLGDFSAREATAILADDSYFRCVVLRNPMARAVSGYLEKFVVNPLPTGQAGEPPDTIGETIDWVYRQRGEAPDYARSVTFREFADYLCSNDDSVIDTHFKSQASYLADQHFDFIGTLENTGRVIEHLESHFGRKIELGHFNPTARKKPLLGRRGLGELLPEQLRARRRLAHDSELINSDLERKLGRRFEQDIRLWQEAMA